MGIKGGLLVMMLLGMVPAVHADGLFSGADLGVNLPDVGPLDPDRPLLENVRRLEDMAAADLQDAHESLQRLAADSPVFGFLRQRVQRALTRQGLTALIVPEGEADGWEVRMTEKTPAGGQRLPVDLEAASWYNTARSDMRNFWVIRNEAEARRVRLANTLTGAEITDVDAYNERNGLPHSFDNELANTDNNLGGITPMDRPVGMGAPVATPD